MKLRVIRYWRRRWTYRPARDTLGYVLENRYEILRNGIIVGKVTREWGGKWSWEIYTAPRRRGWADTMTQALHDARDALGLRQVVADGN